MLYAHSEYVKFLVLIRNFSVFADLIRLLLAAGNIKN